jgi:hypothetical protein
MDIASCVCKHNCEEAVLVLKNNFKYVCLKFNFEIAVNVSKLQNLFNATWADDNMLACPSRWKRGANNAPCHQVLRQMHATTAHVSKTSPRSPHGRNGGRTCTTSSGGAGVETNTPTHQVQSRHVTTHQSPTCALQ